MSRHGKQTADIPFFRGVRFMGSFAKVQDCPSNKLPVIVFTGRSNSGKSSLISTICNHSNLARVSKTAGKTQTINYYLVPELKGQRPCYLVDLPGFGFARLSGSARDALRAMVDEYLSLQAGIQVMVLVLDARREPDSEEESIIEWCRSKSKAFVFARSKWDKFSSNEKAARLREWSGTSGAIPISNLDFSGISDLIEVLVSKTQ